MTTTTGTSSTAPTGSAQKASSVQLPLPPLSQAAAAASSTAANGINKAVSNGQAALDTVRSGIVAGSTAATQQSADLATAAADAMAGGKNRVSPVTGSLEINPISSQGPSVAPTTKAAPAAAPAKPQPTLTKNPSMLPSAFATANGIAVEAGAGAPADAADAAAANGKLPSKVSSAKEVSFKITGKDVANAMSEAGKEYVAAGKEATATMKTIAKLPFTKEKATLTVDHIVTLLFFIGLGFNLLLLWLFSRTILGILFNVLTGLVFGLGLSWLYFHNKRKKAEANALLATVIGYKGVQYLVGGLPSWYSNTKTEKLEWFNSLLEELWPYVDKAVCDMIKDITSTETAKVLKSQPALNKIVKTIGFKHLTFGLAPFRVESIWVSPDDKQQLVMEVSVKWCGDPNITLAIETTMGQKLCPRVMDITFIGTIKLVLNPLVDRIPGFVAAMATLRKPPMIKYRLDFGKALGGAALPAAVTPVINYFMKDIIEKMLVWPQRLVVPILQQKDEDKLVIQRMMLRNKGVLRIYVRDIKEMPAKDLTGLNDPYVKITTDCNHFEKTKVAKSFLDKKGGKKGDRNAQKAIWKEYKYLLVQEPTEQTLRIEVFEYDMLPTSILTGEVGADTLIGRAMIKLQDQICPSPGVNFMSWYPLGEQDWGSPGGPGKGSGKLRLKMMYKAFEDLTQEEVTHSTEGILIVRILKVVGLPRAPGKKESLQAYVRVRVKGNDAWETVPRTWNRKAHVAKINLEVAALMKKLAVAKEEADDELVKKTAKEIEVLNSAIEKDQLSVDLDYTLDNAATVAFYNVKYDDDIKIKVMEMSSLSQDESMARKDGISVSTDVINACTFNPLSGKDEYGFFFGEIELDDAAGAKMVVALRWVPHLPDPEEDDEIDEEDTAAAELESAKAPSRTPSAKPAP